MNIGASDWPAWISFGPFGQPNMVTFHTQTSCLVADSLMLPGNSFFLIVKSSNLKKQNQLLVKICDIMDMGEHGMLTVRDVQSRWGTGE